jgi:hypothetical protein
LADLSLIFSCLENLVAFCHISEFHTLLRKSSHTHALHELSNLFKISICKKICAYWILNSHLYLWIFLQCYLTTLSVDYTSVFWSKLLGKYFSAYFPQVSDFQVWSIRTDLFFVQTRAVLPYADLAVAHLDRISIGLRLASLSLPYTHLCIFIDLSCCVFFSWISLKILAFFAHLFSSHDLHCVFRYSFKFLCF